MLMTFILLHIFLVPVIFRKFQVHFWSKVESEMNLYYQCLASNSQKFLEIYENTVDFYENIIPVTPIIQPPKCYKYNCTKYYQKRHQPKIKLIKYQVNYNSISSIWIYSQMPLRNFVHSQITSVGDTSWITSVGDKF